MVNSTYGKPRRLGLGHKIFLSHSGADKDFVWFLDAELREMSFDPFFDEESLPKANIVTMENILGEVKHCSLGLFVLSDDFFTKTKNPMLELVAFVHHEVQLLPLFYKLTVEQFKDRNKRETWRDKWREWQQQDGSINIPEWDRALDVLGRCNGMEFQKVAANPKKYVEAIAEKVCEIAQPEIPRYDRHVQGKGRLCKVVETMFAQCSPIVRGAKVLGLHADGGMGKSTLCKALCNFYHAEFGGRVCHVELDSTPYDYSRHRKFERLKTVLIQLTGAKHTFLQQHVTDLDQAYTYLDDRLGTSRKVFLVVDNIQDFPDSQEEAIDLFLRRGPFPSGSKILLMGRSKDVLSKLFPPHVDRMIRHFPLLHFDEAKSIFVQAACLCEEQQRIHETSIIQCVDVCTLNQGRRDYHPLMLICLGSFLKEHPSELVSSVKGLKKEAKAMDRVFELLQKSYDSLEKHEQDLFLDIALYAARKDMEWLRQLHDRPEEAYSTTDTCLEKLRALSFLRRENSYIKLHDVYMEFAKKLAVRSSALAYVEGRKLRQPDVYDILTASVDRLERVAFVRCEFEDEDSLDLSGCLRMRVLLLKGNRGLKDLKLGQNTCKHLRSVEIDSPDVMMDVEGCIHYTTLLTTSANIFWKKPPLSYTSSPLKNLLHLEIGSYFGKQIVGKVNLEHVSECAQLRIVKLCKITLTSSCLDLSCWPNLRQLHLEELPNVIELSGMNALTKLTVAYCESMLEIWLPEKIIGLSLQERNVFSKLTAISVTDFSEGCKGLAGGQKLVRLLQYATALRSLKILCEEDCRCDVHPPSFHLLPNLESLVYTCCSVIDLSSIGRCTKLITLDVSGCTDAEILPDFSQLASLRRLEMCDCDSWPEGLEDLLEWNQWMQCDVSGISGCSAMPIEELMIVFTPGVPYVFQTAAIDALSGYYLRDKDRAEIAECILSRMDYFISLHHEEKELQYLCLGLMGFLHDDHYGVINKEEARRQLQQLVLANEGMLSAHFLNANTTPAIVFLMLDGVAAIVELSGTSPLESIYESEYMGAVWKLGTAECITP